MTGDNSTDLVALNRRIKNPSFLGL